MRILNYLFGKTKIIKQSPLEQVKNKLEIMEAKINLFGEKVKVLKKRMKSNEAFSINKEELQEIRDIAMEIRSLGQEICYIYHEETFPREESVGAILGNRFKVDVGLIPNSPQFT